MSATPEEPVDTAGTTDAQVVTDVPRPSFFSSSPHERLRRRPSDLLLAAACVCAIAALVLLSPASAQLEAASAALVDSLPGILRPVWLVGWGALVVWALVLLLAAAVRPGRRTLLLHCLVGAALGCLVALVARTEPGGAADALSILGVVGFLICCAVVVTASPHLARPYRRAGRVLLVWAAVSLVLLGTPPVAVTVALVAGSLGAALAHLAFGSPGGRPTVKHVKRALAELGVEVVDLAESGRQVPGETRFVARAPDGSPLAVTVLGRDTWDSQFLTSIWTALWRRGERPHIHRSRSTLVEHQAMALLIAQRAGVSVAPLVGVGTSSEGDAILVTRAGGRSLRDAGPDDVSDDALHEAWRQLLALHAAGVSHGNIDMDRLQLCDGAIVLTDFRDAAVPGLPQDLLSDRARLLVAGALACGQDRAISAAVSALGREGLADILGYVQPPVVGRSMRRDVRERPWKLNDLLAGAAAACDVPAPQPAPVARISARQLAASAFFVVVAWALVSWLLTLDFAAIWSALMGADWAVLGLALALSPLIQPGLALATLGSSLARLRYGPALMLEYAIQFMSLTLPSTAARVGVQVQFFRRFGITAATAVTMGVIGSLSGFAVQLALILLVLLADLPGFTTQVLGDAAPSTDDSSSDPALIVFALGFLVAGVVVALVVPASRRHLLQVIRAARRSAHEQASGAREALQVLRRPGKVGRMAGGNLAAQLLSAIILGVCLHAFGYSATMSQLVLIHTVVSLFGGLIPVPGNIGVAEAGYTLGLRAIGIPSAEAVSVAIAFRLITFYLPPLWGGPAFHWLRRHSYL